MRRRRVTNRRVGRPFKLGVEPLSERLTVMVSAEMFHMLHAIAGDRIGQFVRDAIEREIGSKDP